MNEINFEIVNHLSNNGNNPFRLLCLNAHIFNLAQKDEKLRDILNKSDIVAADGVSIVLLLYLLRNKIGERCNMTDTFLKFIKNTESKKYDAILIGMSETEAKLASEYINKCSNCCTIKYYFSGFLRDNEYEAILKENREIDIVLIGMSSPRSEIIADLASNIIKCAVIWHIGAGTIRILAGTMKDAPNILKKFGLQWVFRLVSEPRKLWKRYFWGNFYFIFTILKNMIVTKLKQICH